MQTHSMTAQDQEALFRRWLAEHLGLMLKVVRGCAAGPQDQDDLFQDVLLGGLGWAAGNIKADVRPNIESATPGYREIQPKDEPKK